MILSELCTKVRNLFDIDRNPNFDADELVTHAIMWYSSFATKDVTADFNIVSGIKSYTFSSDYKDAVPQFIIDDDDTLLYSYSVHQAASNGDFYVLPTDDSFKLIFRETPTRTRGTTLLYTRRITIPTQDSDVIDVPDRHIHVLMFFIQALAESKRQTHFIWSGLPEDYEAYFLNQTGEQVRRSWERCMEEREKIQKESFYDNLNLGFVINWSQMEAVDSLIRPVYYGDIY